uniref:Reverse transcriptase Ty1/copia-type domain-containing protein n=1 Tax=Tanacetum cinerariifolium TaxID=118510 RepID=A0A6L2LAR2_TANCI|nr:hypothetical protein [Tanacetum cinerariifolium]
MTDYSIWEVILNGDSPLPTRVIEGVVQPLAPTTTKQRLDMKNELKARGTLLMALPDKHQLKFNIHKDAKTLMEAIEKLFGRNKETKKIYEAEVKRSSSASTSTQNITFVSSQNTDNTNEFVSAVTSVFAASAKVHVSALPNVDTLSDAIIYSFFASQSNSSQLDNDDLKQIDADDLEEMDLKWQVALLTMRARRRGHFARECRSPKDTRRNVPVKTQRRNVPVETSTFNALVSQYDGVGSYDWSFQAKEEPTNYALMAFTSSSSSSSDNKVASYSKACTKAYATLQSEFDVSMPASPVYDMYKSKEGYHVVPPPYIGTFMPPKRDLVFYDAPTVNETVYTAFNVELSPTKPNKDLSQSNRPSSPIIKDWVSDSEDESKAKLTQNAPTDHLTKDIPKSRGHRNSRNKKACFVCKSLTHLIKDCDYYEKKMVQTPARNHAQRANHYVRMTHPNPQSNMVPTIVLTRSKLVPLTTARLVTTDVPQPYVTRPRPAKNVVTKSPSPPRRTINLRPSPTHSNFHQKVTTIKTCQVNADKGVKGNMSYLSDFKEINGGYVAFGGNPKGGKITDTECIVLSSDFKLSNENHVLLRVPRENNMYNVDLKNIIPSGDLTCLFPKATLDKTPSIGFMRPFGCHVTILNTLDPLENKPNVAGSGTTWLFDIDTLTKSMNYQPVTAGNQPNPSVGIQEQFNAEKAREENVQQYVLFPLWSSGSKDPHNNDDDTTFEVKEPKFKVKKPESKVHVSLSSSAKTKKHDDKTKREAKGKSPVELSIGFRNLSEEFEDFFDDRTNEVNAASTPVPTVGQILTNSTNTFSADGPSNTAIRQTLGKYSYMDPSQYLDDLNMPALEDITYSDDEEVAGAEAGFTNLKTTITISPIPTTTVHKDHHMTQIIGDLSLATQTRSMTRMVKYQGHTQEEGIDYKEVFALVARIESIRLFLAYASFMGFMVYQMDVKSVFLYVTIEEEVHVCQSLGFEDPDYPDKVYKVVKALYGLHQDPRAWYETLANYLLENGFQRGKIHQILFIKKQKGDILLVQVYVDDIIFSSTNKDLCKAFEKLMKDKFWMSSMGELTFFLDGKSASTPIDTEKPLLKDPNVEDVDVHTYRSMIGSLMYLTSSRPKIMFAVCACDHFQVTPKASHLHAVKRIFRYLKGKPHLGLWYLKDLPFNLVAYLDSDYAGARLDRKTTTGGCQLLCCRLISWQCKKQIVVATSSTKAEYVAVASCCAKVL